MARALHTAQAVPAPFPAKKDNMSCTCNRELLPKRNNNVSQYCVCGSYSQLTDYENNIMEQSFFNFYKDLSVHQDYVLNITTVSSPWLNMEFPLVEDEKELMNKIKIYVLMT